MRLVVGPGQTDAPVGGRAKVGQVLAAPFGHRHAGLAQEELAKGVWIREATEAREGLQLSAGIGEKRLDARELHGVDFLLNRATGHGSEAVGGGTAGTGIGPDDRFGLQPVAGLLADQIERRLRFPVWRKLEYA